MTSLPSLKVMPMNRSRTRRGAIDLAFIDADKEGYVDYLNKLLARLRQGGLILAHNVDMVPDYVHAVTTNPDLETIFYMEGAGLAVTLKKPPFFRKRP